VNEESQSEVMEDSALEVAEAVLEAEAKWKRKPKNSASQIFQLQQPIRLW